MKNCFHTSLPAVLLALFSGTAAAQDCNDNGIDDTLDIQNGTSEDCNQNLVPDECELFETVFEYGFDGGSLPPGVDLTFGGFASLWHTTTACPPPGTCAGGTFAYFGIDATCNFDNGDWVFGFLVFHDVQLPTASGLELTYCSAYEGEGNPAGYDTAYVRARDANTPTAPWVTIDRPLLTRNQGVWESRQGDLTEFAGSTIDLAFSFDSADAKFNEGFGWGIDEVRIVGSEDVNGNGILDTCECTVVRTCQTSPNTVGPGAEMDWTGSSSISQNHLILRASGLPFGQFGIFYYGPNDTLTPFGDGFRCVGEPIHRLPVVPTTGGVASFDFDTENPLHNPGDLVRPGATHSVQFWYRDNLPGGAPFNLSDALRITFCD